MADFDPNAYLASKSTPSGGFDPDAYLKSFDPDQYLKSKGSPDPKTSAGAAFNEHAGNAITLGYLPQLQAKAEPVTDRLFKMFTGDKGVEPAPMSQLTSNDDNYVKARDANVKRIDTEHEEHPYASNAGTIGGSVVGALATPLPGGAASKGLLRTLGEGAAVGAGYGAIQNPGDEPGKVDILQGKERLENAETGAKAGAASAAASRVVGGALKGLANSGDTARELESTSAVKASGGMLKDFRQLDGKNQTEEFGQFLRKNKLVEAGDTVSDVAQKSSALQDQAGKALDDIYNKTKEIPVNKEFYSPHELSGFNPVQDRDEILSAVKDRLGDSVKSKSALKQVSDYLDDLSEKYGDKYLDPRKSNDIKGAMDKEVNYARNPLNKQPESETAFNAARQIVSKKIDASIDAIGKSTDDPDLLAKLKEANKTYGFAKKAADMSEDYVNRTNANRHISLTDTIAGGAGSMVGGGVIAATGDHDPRHAGEGALVGGAIGALTNHVGRKYGPGLLSAGAGRAAPVLDYSVAPVAQGLSKIPAEAMTRAGIESVLASKQRDKNKGLLPDQR